MNPKLLQIDRAICAEFDVLRRELYSANRERHVAEAKHAAVMLMFELTRMKRGAIAKRLKADHRTVINSVQRATFLIDSDPDYRNRYTRAKSLLTKSK